MHPHATFTGSHGSMRPTALSISLCAHRRFTISLPCKKTEPSSIAQDAQNAFGTNDAGGGKARPPRRAIAQLFLTNGPRTRWIDRSGIYGAISASIDQMTWRLRYSLEHKRSDVALLGMILIPRSRSSRVRYFPPLKKTRKCNKERVFHHVVQR